ncbi:MAG: hypothetical protein KAS04_06310 [Candidatus Aenigmarchaeota archaeon]|nr:hypothetical protein [Candidatus Aenigmarchaeota archaeon]
MIPQIFPDDIATVKPISEQLSAQRIYLYESDNQLILHRLLYKPALTSACVIFKGDYNGFFDPPVREEQIIGQIESIIKTPASIIHRIKFQIKKLRNAILRK